MFEKSGVDVLDDASLLVEECLLDAPDFEAAAFDVFIFSVLCLSVLWVFISRVFISGVSISPRDWQLLDEVLQPSFETSRSTIRTSTAQTVFKPPMSRKNRTISAHYNADRAVASTSEQSRRVLIFYNTGWYVFIFRRNLIKRLQERGYEVVALTPEDAYVEKIRSLQVKHAAISLKPHSTNPFAEMLTLFDTFRSLIAIRPRYILSYTIKCNLYAGLCSRLLRCAQIANVSGLGEVFDKRGLLNSLVRLLYRVSLGRAHTVFFQNREDMNLCLKERLVPKSAARLIPGSGIDVTQFVPSPPKATDAPKVFLMFGRLLPRKGYPGFLLAAEELCARYGNSVQFWILGKEDAARADSVQLLEGIRRAHEQGIVRYFEPTDDVLPILSRADVVVLPSTYNEGIPRSLLEGLACGKAIVTTDWKGCRETVVDGENGFIVAPNDDRSLFEALEKIAKMPRSELERLGAASRKLAETRFDEKIVLDAYLEAIESVPAA